MNILYVINTLGKGGAENLIYNIAKYSKHNIDILVLSGDDNVYDVTKFRNVRLFISPYKKIRDFRHTKFIKKILLENNYNIVHANLFPSFYYVSMAKSRKFKETKFIYTEHSTSNKRRRFGFRFLENYIYSKYDSIISISEGVYTSLNKWLNKKNINKNNIVYNGIDIDKFSNEIAYSKEQLDSNFTSEDVLILMSARFTPQKDQNTLIRSLKYLPEKFKLLLAGDGLLLNNSRDLALSLDLEKRVHFLGFRTDISSITKTVDIIVVSSIIEGFGLVAIEGSAAGKPVIASNVPGLKETIQYKELLFEVGDYHKLADLIKMVEGNVDYIANVDNIKKFSIESMLQNLDTLYVTKKENKK